MVPTPASQTHAPTKIQICMGLTLFVGVAAGSASASSIFTVAIPVRIAGCAIRPRFSGTKSSAAPFCVRSSRPNRLKPAENDTGQHRRNAAALQSA